MKLGYVIFAAKVPDDVVVPLLKELLRAWESPSLPKLPI